jgi:4-oxalocrotonate tautomerase family enzyme
MPYVNIKVTREGVTHKQKAELIRGVTDLLVSVLDKSPATTFVVIDEVAMEDWGIGGLPVEAFPLQGRSYCSSPEIFLARKLGAKLSIVQGYLFPTASQQPVFGDFIKKCLAERAKYPKRSLDSMFWKEIGNSTYGKTAQGLRLKRVYDHRDRDTKPLPPSRLTNPFYASFITSYVRAVLGEIMNAIPPDKLVFSCTTDGFLTNAEDRDMTIATAGELCSLFRDARTNLTGLPTLLETKHVVRRPLGWTTRGQATLVPGESTSDDPSFNFVLAKAGITIPQDFASLGEDNKYIVDLFFGREPTTRIDVNPLTGIRDIIEHDADLVTKQVDKRLNMEFDWKRKPNAIGMHPRYDHLMFSTRPWTSVDDFVRVRDKWTDFRSINPTCLKTVCDYEAFASYADTKFMIETAGSDAYVKSQNPDLALLKLNLCSAWRQSRAGLKWQRGGAANFAALLSDAGIPAMRHDAEYGKNRDFVPNQCPPTPRCIAAIGVLKATFPDLREEELFMKAASATSLATVSPSECPFISKALSESPTDLSQRQSDAEEALPGSNTESNPISPHQMELDTISGWTQLNQILNRPEEKSKVDSKLATAAMSVPSIWSALRSTNSFKAAPDRN